MVTDYLVGAYALFERLAAWPLGRAVLHTLGLRRSGAYRIPWHRLDLTDAERPRLACALEELPRLEEDEYHPEPVRPDE